MFADTSVSKYGKQTHEGSENGPKPSPPAGKVAVEGFGLVYAVGFPAAGREGADIVLIRPVIGRPRGCKHSVPETGLYAALLKADGAQSGGQGLRWKPFIPNNKVCAHEEVENQPVNCDTKACAQRTHGKKRQVESLPTGKS